MTSTFDASNLHRTAKLFLDNGRAATVEEALAILETFGLTIFISPELAMTANGQIALLTLVNLTRRTFLGGVEVVDCPAVPLQTALSLAGDLKAAVIELGGAIVDVATGSRPWVVIGGAATDQNAPVVFNLAWDGWRAGVLVGKTPVTTSPNAVALTPALAAAVCASELFSYFAADDPLAGRRDAGLSLWRPGQDWTRADPTEPDLSFLPSRLWLIGLGNLGQAYAWLIACLPYADRQLVELMLQDFDLMAESNDSTSLLATRAAIGKRKTRWVANWLDQRGFTTLIEERRFGAWTHRQLDEPAAALCGVDNGRARADLDAAGFDLVVESGLGAGTQSFRSLAMHCLPGPRSSTAIWGQPAATAPDVSMMPAYEELAAGGMDKCGLAQLASRTIGVPFVGLIAGALVISELLRRLHGGPAHAVIAGSSMTLEDLEAVEVERQVYAYGHCAV